LDRRQATEVVQYVESLYSQIDRAATLTEAQEAEEPLKLGSRTGTTKRNHQIMLTQYHVSVKPQYQDESNSCQ
jgi:hypothetical protein